jgi:hypothetical protein
MKNLVTRLKRLAAWEREAILRFLTDIPKKGAIWLLFCLPDRIVGLLAGFPVHAYQESL